MITRHGRTPTLDEIMDKATEHCDALEKYLEAIDGYLQAAENVNYKVSTVDVHQWREEATKRMAALKLFVTVLTAWDVIFDKSLQDAKSVERKETFKDLKPDLLNNCCKVRPFPAKMLLVFEQWISSGKADVAIKSVS